MREFFEKCSDIITIDLTDFDSSNVTNMRNIFSECIKLKEIKGITKLITNKIIDMSGMFQGCKELEYLDLSNFNTENATKMNHMFNKCSKLRKIDGINRFITNKVTTMKSMFQLCQELEYLDLSSFNNENVKDTSWMFAGCEKLEYLNLNDFSLNNKTTTDNMFMKLQKNICKFITNNNDLLNIYNSS